VTTAINSALQAGVGGASALAMSAGKISQNGLGTQPQLGMSMWFDVIVHDTDMEQGGDQMLGDWASCSGLSVKFNTEALDEGGEYDSPWHMPTKITYGEITLERAMVKETSARVEKWLTQVAANWMNGDDGGAKDRSMAVGTTIVIALRSSLGAGKQGDNIVHMWTLKDAIPVGWSGPTLSAKGNEIATEKLTIAHRGFLTSKPGAGSAAKSDKAEQGKLKLSYEGTNVEFPYNPKTVTLDKTVTIDEGKIQGLEPQVTDSGKLSLKFSALRVEGAKAVKASIDQLWGWLDPIPPPPAPATPAGETAVAGGASAPAPEPTAPAGDSASTEASGKKEKKKKKALGTPKKLVLNLGTALTYTVLLRAVSASYTRFNKNGEPTRADVTLTLQVDETPPAKTNPSSGGRPGGQLHTAIAGDTLPAIATATYGDPGAWRDIAQDNGIDDPMRMKPGRTLYLAGA
jgi:phage tail-like protein